MRGTQSMLQVIGACKPVSRLARGDCSDQHCCPERAWCVVALSMFEYYVYSINHGQESALDGWVPRAAALGLGTAEPGVRKLCAAAATSID